MNIKNTMCRLSELTSEQIDILRNAMPKGQYDFFTTENVIGATSTGKWGTWDIRGLERKTVTYTEMMQLLGKTMKEFTKSDLKTGMVVRYRDGEYRILIDKVLTGIGGFNVLSLYNDSLLGVNASNVDIVAVYNMCNARPIDIYLKGEHLTLIWERTEQTPAQKEMEVLQAKMDELQEQIKVVQAKL
jgi:hypothetical protein